MEGDQPEGAAGFAPGFAPSETPYTMSVDDKLSKAMEYKLEGNQRFKDKKLKGAIGKYHRALLYLKGVKSPKELGMIASLNPPTELTEEQKERLAALKVDCYNNLAACLLQTEEPNHEKILQYCDCVIELSPTNVKALYRKGVASLKLKNTELALECFQRAQSLPAGQADPKIKQHLLFCEKELKRQDKRMQQTYKSMFNKMASDKEPEVAEGKT